MTTPIVNIDLGTANQGNGSPLRDGGAIINNNFSNLDGRLSAVELQTATSYTLQQASANLLGGVKIGANVTIDANGTISVASPYIGAPFPNAAIANPGSSLLYARGDHVHKTDVPFGTIIMWYGTVNGSGNWVSSSVPSGWKLCDGSSFTYDGHVLYTPDLRDRFIMVAGTVHAHTTTGGSDTPTLPRHSHSATFVGNTLPTHAHPITDNGHSHDSQYDGRTPDGIDGQGAGSEIGGMGTTYTYPTTTSTTGISINATTAGTPTGSISVTEIGVASGSLGGLNNPEFYALIHIMKIS